MQFNFWHYDPLKNKNWVFTILLIITFLLAFYLRINKLTKSPPGFYADEASIAYNAYSILKTGKDEHNIAWPLFFRAFGEYKNPIFIYSLVPLIALRGLTPEVIRMGAGIWGALAIPLIIWFAVNISGNRLYGVLTGLILALMPWHLHYSRIAFEAITFPTLLIISLVFFQSWLTTEKNLYGAIFGLSLGLTFYTYTTARFWVPIIIFLLILLFKNQLIKKKKKTVLFFSLTLLTILPVFFWERAYPGSLTGRFNSIVIWNKTQNIKEVFYKFLEIFLRHWHPRFLFYSGDITIIRHSSRTSSELLISWGLPFLMGIILIFRYLIKEKVWQFVLILIITFPLASSFTQTNPMATRTIQATPFFALIIALALFWIVKTLSEKKKNIIFWVAVLSLTIILEFSYYYYHLIKIYPKMSWMSRYGFDGSLPQAIYWADQKRKKDNLPLYLSSKIDEVNIQGLFFTKADPLTWQKNKKAPFKIIFLEKDKGLNGVAVLLKHECQRNKNINILKRFGREEDELFDYCVVRLK